MNNGQLNIVFFLLFFYLNDKTTLVRGSVDYLFKCGLWVIILNVVLNKQLLCVFSLLPYMNDN